MADLRHPRVVLAVLTFGLTVAGAAALAFASSGGDGSDDEVFGIELRDGSIAVESPTLEAGRQVIEATNGGTEEHEVVLVRTTRSPDDIPVGLHGVSPSLAGDVVIGEDHAANGHRHPAGVVLGLLPGQSRTYEAELRPGAYVLLCQTANHYLEGERAAFEVR